MYPCEKCDKFAVIRVQSIGLGADLAGEDFLGVPRLVAGCADVQMCGCADCGCADVRICGCADVRIADMRMRGNSLAI
jgi:hypothetical protein